MDLLTILEKTVSSGKFQKNAFYFGSRNLHRCRGRNDIFRSLICADIHLVHFRSKWIATSTTVSGASRSKQPREYSNCSVSYSFWLGCNSRWRVLSFSAAVSTILRKLFKTSVQWTNTIKRFMPKLVKSESLQLCRRSETKTSKIFRMTLLPLWVFPRCINLYGQLHQ